MTTNDHYPTDFEMADTKPALSHERLLELLHYDGETGKFTRQVSVGRHGCHRAGVVVGSPKRNGYLDVALDGRKYLIHRLAWFYLYCEWPPHDVDHINGVRDDNSSGNLRLATRSENMQNQRRPSSRGSSGFLGCTFFKRDGTWKAQIGVDKKNHHIGYFATPELAHAAYVAAKRSLHPMGTL